MYSKKKSSKKSITQKNDEAAMTIQRKIKKTIKNTEKNILSESLSPTIHILEQENICKDYKKLLKKRRFDLIAIDFGLAISKIVPFKEKASYDYIF